jgi:hypothetical protein
MKPSGKFIWKTGCNVALEYCAARTGMVKLMAALAPASA